MLPMIGIMVGMTGIMIAAYTFTKLLAVATDSKNHTIVQIFAVIALLISCVGGVACIEQLFALLNAGLKSRGSSGLPF